MVVIKCPYDGCSYQTPDECGDVIGPLLKIHAMVHERQQPVTSHSVPQQSTTAPKMNRPIIDAGVDQEAWLMFTRRWKAFRIGCHINDDIAAIQLFQCASERLGDLMLKSDPKIMMKSVQEVLTAMESLAVIKVAVGVRRVELMKMTQDHDEEFRTFATKVRGKAETCEFNTLSKCSCGIVNRVDYTEEAIKDVMLAGISDVDIRRETVSNECILSKTYNEIISFVEGREMGRKATGESTSVSAISSFRRLKKEDGNNNNSAQDKSKQIACPSCSKLFHPFRKKNNYWNARPFKICLNCWRDKQKPSSTVQALEVSSEDVIQQDVQISALDSSDEILLSSKIFNKKELRRTRETSHPKARFYITLEGMDYSIPIEGIADTGAQSNLWGWDDFRKAGFKRQDLQTVRITIRAANKHPINILGAVKATFSGVSPEGITIKCNDIVYVSDSVTGFFLSYATMVDLLIVNKSFPVVGGCSNLAASTEELTVNAVQTTCAEEGDTPCDCPRRTDVPPHPSHLPFEAKEENIDKMRNWLLKRYGSSTFNTCPHRPLQQMDGPPVDMHVGDDAKPRVCNTPAPIPLHWAEQVHAGLLRDEALGILEPVPYGVSPTWCHRMVVTRKHDGSPRRTVDLSPLNKYCKRETFPSEAPFHLARRVPRNTWKTVTDAWNGYHSVPLRESDRHLTTFITQFGRWRYTRAPQGFVSSGDGYNRRFAAIISDFQRKERCVDDTIHYDENIKDRW